MKKPRAAILLAAGINCDKETEYGFILAGGETKRIHINDLIEKKEDLSHYHILVIPGGFSFGDDISSGKVLANKIKCNLEDEIQKFINDKKLILGICNGFQVMVKLGLLPAINKDYKNQTASLVRNNSGKFEDRWVYLKPNQNSNCVFTKNINQLLYLPVRHGEGKFVVKDENILESLKNKNGIVLQYVDSKGRLGDYPVNPNGSIEHIAGICDESGLVFGLMPHPEGYISKTQHPQWTRKANSSIPNGLLIFKNAVEYARENLL
ncbi:MAG: phosphoribosylformylglycinamidine synthase I [Actinobacteria bacterium]|nr:phosphoribosylformylglycinamidine synthase I [Actinomycetota bacterium]